MSWTWDNVPLADHDVPAAQSRHSLKQRRRSHIFRLGFAKFDVELVVLSLKANES